MLDLHPAPVRHYFLSPIFGSILHGGERKHGYSPPHYIFKQRLEKLTATDFPGHVKIILTTILKRISVEFEAFSALNREYTRQVIKEQFWYYLGVLVLFFILVFMNYTWVRVFKDVSG